MMERVVPTITIHPHTFDIAAMYGSAFDPMEKWREQMNKQAASVLGTATKANAQLQAMVSTSITAQAALQDLFPRADLPAQIRATLDFSFKTPTIADYLARTNTTSIFSFQGPTIAEQLGTRIDTKTLMGMTGLADTAGRIAERWRLANTGALSNFGESFNSLSAALDFNEALKSSSVAWTLAGAAGSLTKANIEALSQINFDSGCAAVVDQIVEEDEPVAIVAAQLEQELVDRYEVSQIVAHHVVRILIWMTTAGILIGITRGIPVLGEVVGTILEVTEIFGPREFSKRAAHKIVPINWDSRADPHPRQISRNFTISNRFY